MEQEDKDLIRLLKRTAIGVAIILLSILFTWIFNSCNPSRKLEKKQEAAVNTVLASRPLLDKVGDEWQKLNPCLNDTTVITKTDTTTVTNEKTDTLYGSTGTSPDTIIQAITRTKVVDHYIRDTVIQVVADRRALDSCNAQKLRVETDRDHFKQLYNATVTQDKELSHALHLVIIALIKKWWFWLTIVLIGLWGFIKIKGIAISSLVNKIK